MTINVINASGWMVELEGLSTTSTVRQLKEMYKTFNGIAVGKQRIHFEGEELGNTWKLSDDCNLPDYSTVVIHVDDKQARASAKSPDLDIIGCKAY